MHQYDLSVYNTITPNFNAQKSYLSEYTIQMTLKIVYKTYYSYIFSDSVLILLSHTIPTLYLALVIAT